VHTHREITTKLNSTAESNRIITQALRMKQEEVEALSAKYEALSQQVRPHDVHTHPAPERTLVPLSLSSVH
jgi:hypothetical protein